MTANKQDKKVEWEKKHVQRVLDYYNKKHSRHIVIKGRATDVYHNLTSRLNWDWVCYDAKTGDDVAIEVKKLTDSDLEEKSNVMWQLLVEVRNSLLGKLPGTFVLSVDFPKEYNAPLARGDRTKFKDVLYKIIHEVAQKSKVGKEEDLKPRVCKKFPSLFSESLNLVSCSLFKTGDDGSVLGLSSGITGFYSRKLDEQELKEFEILVSHANRQLSQATNAKQTFLVIIEEGQRITYPDTVAEAFKRINQVSYSHINHVYYVSGKEVVEIPLPTP